MGTSQWGTCKSPQDRRASSLAERVDAWRAHGAAVVDEAPAWGLLLSGPNHRNPLNGVVRVPLKSQRRDTWGGGGGCVLPVEDVIMNYLDDQLT